MEEATLSHLVASVTLIALRARWIVRAQQRPRRKSVVEKKSTIDILMNELSHTQNIELYTPENSSWVHSHLVLSIGSTVVLDAHLNPSTAKIEYMRVSMRLEHGVMNGKYLVIKYSIRPGMGVTVSLIDPKNPQPMSQQIIETRCFDASKDKLPMSAARLLEPKHEADVTFIHAGIVNLWKLLRNDRWRKSRV